MRIGLGDMLIVPKLTLRFLGSPQIERDGVSVSVSRRKSLALLAYLTCEGAPQQRDRLAALLWPDLDQSEARGQLRRVLWSLNHDLDSSWLDADRETIELTHEADLWLDVHQFQAHIKSCQTHGHPESQPCAQCRPTLQGAVELYRGEFLAGFSLRDSPEFDEWQFFKAEELRQQFASALVRLIHLCSARSELESAISYARRWLALDPLEESAHRWLMRLYHDSGQHIAALHQYETCVKVLAQELGVNPQAATTELYKSIKGGRVERRAVTVSIEPDTSYAKSGPYHIAYQVFGSGPVDMVWLGGFVTHIEQAWEEPRLAQFRDQVTTFSR